MTLGAIVQARMSSLRLPGKVLRPVAGKPLLQYLLERLARASSLDSVLVATSTEPSDDGIAELCARLGIGCHRGDLLNVCLRFKQAIARHGLDAFARISGDSPLLDPGLVDRAVALYRRGLFDLVTNVHPRTFPPGQSVEVISKRAFESAFEAMSDPEDLEHVTRYFYRNATRYRLHCFRAEADWSTLPMAVDTERDIEVFTAVIARMGRPHWDYRLEELVPLYELALEES